jgi:hypothetical protein
MQCVSSLSQVIGAKVGPMADMVTEDTKPRPGLQHDLDAHGREQVVKI